MFVHQKSKFMKKITLLTVLLVSLAGFSQSSKQLIQSYFDANRTKMALSSQDVSDWIIQSEVPGSGTKITSTYIVQRYQGTEVFQSFSNFAVKDGKVLNAGSRFVSNIAQKVNATTPSLSVIQAVTAAYSKLGITARTNYTIQETLNSKSFMLSDGVQEDPISAKLVYQTVGEKLNLAWALQFYSPDGNHLWDLRIDALNGSILEKNDLTVSCNFGDKKHAGNHKKGFSFEELVFNKTNTMAVATPGTYRVIPYNYASPNHHAFELITTAGNPVASPQGWHDANALGGTTSTLIFNYTRGNNVLAQEDRDGNDGSGVRPTGGATMTFDFPYGGYSAQTATYTPAATTNAFYMTNIMHDVWYQYGFDEASHNFQANNYGKGGTVTTSGDYIFVDSQDGAANTAVYTVPGQNRNNSNFATGNDGLRPRLQTYIWDLGAPSYNFLNVNSPAAIAGPKVSKDNSFDTTDHIALPEAPNAITADIVLVQNGPTPPGHNSACQPISNNLELTGKIALIKRGSCLFSFKVKTAQDAGAVAAIIMDSIPQVPGVYEGTIGMTSTGVLGITIPAISVNNDVGNAIIAQLANGPVSGTIQSPGNLFVGADGDFENVVIAHEFGHGISNRLIGAGLGGCMTNAEQMGEGWSDWFGLMMQLKAGDVGATPVPIATFAANEPNDGGGIRAFPYSNDMSVNPLTLSASNEAEEHNRGETWAATLWDLTWAYVGKYGFDADIYNGTGGNNKVMRLILDALKLETCRQDGFINARNAIIAADQATTGGADYCLITDVFTRRGMGLNASSGDVNNAQDQVEDFTPFPAGPNCTLGINYFDAKDLFRVYPNPSNGTFNIRISQFTGKVNLEVVDINGRVVYNQKNQDFNVEKTVNLNHLQKGMYVLKVSGTDVNYTQKIIIK